jgi:predicted lipoprotein
LLGKFNPQKVTSTAWATATVHYCGQKLFAALDVASEQRLSEFNGKEVANTAWAFATVNFRDEKLFTALT